jgi:probable F420-dependent oxidoreductase
VKTPATIGVSAYGYEPADLLAFARCADAFGVDCFWVGEHYVTPRTVASAHPSLSAAQYEEDEILASDVRIYDPWFTLGAVAGATSRLKIGTAICVAPMLHPLLLARAAVSAHELSGGRFLCGIGAGWLKEEFEAFAIPFAERGSRLDETIEILRKAWNGGFFAHDGAHFHFKSLQISPHRVRIPVVCGGNSPPALRRVGRVADAWLNSSLVSLENALRMRESIEAERRAQGTGERPFTYFVRPASCAPQEVERFTAAGFDNIVFWGHDVWSPNPGDVAEKRDKLAQVLKDLGLNCGQSH